MIGLVVFAFGLAMFAIGAYVGHRARRAPTLDEALAPYNYGQLAEQTTSNIAPPLHIEP